MTNANDELEEARELLNMMKDAAAQKSKKKTISAKDYDQLKLDYDTVQEERNQLLQRIGELEMESFKQDEWQTDLKKNYEELKAQLSEMKSAHQTKESEIESLREQVVAIQNEANSTTTPISRGLTKQYELEVETLKIAHEEQVKSLEQELATAKRLLEKVNSKVTIRTDTHRIKDFGTYIFLLRRPKCFRKAFNFAEFAPFSKFGDKFIE